MRHSGCALIRLGGVRVGTIRGYRYPEVEFLQPGVLRDNAVNDSQNLEKLLRGRFDYIFTNRIYFDYQLKTHPERGRLATHNLRITDFDTYCAVGTHCFVVRKSTEIRSKATFCDFEAITVVAHDDKQFAPISYV